MTISEAPAIPPLSMSRVRRPGAVWLTLASLIGALLVSGFGASDAYAANTASVSGTISGAESPSTPLLDIFVVICTMNRDYCASDSTDATGHFALFGLPVGTYSLDIYPEESGSVFAGVPTVQLTLAEGEAITHDFLLSLGATVSGNVKGAGTPPTNISGGNVLLRDAGLFGHWTPYQTTTDSSGDFSFIGVRSGVYTLQYSETLNPNFITFLEAKGPEFSVELGEVITGRDIVLPQGASISGNVKTQGSSNLNLEGAEISATAVTDAYADYPFQASTDSSGNYSVTGLPAGDYNLSITDPSGDYAAVIDHFVSLNAGESAPGLNFVLAPGSSISGTLALDGYPSIPEGYEATVNVYNQSGKHVGDVNIGPLGDDTYTIRGLPAGDYTLVTSVSRVGYQQSPFAPEWWNDQVSQEDATYFALTTGQGVTGKDVTLSIGATISGHISGQGSPDTDLTSMTVYLVTGGSSLEPSPTQLTFTDENGDFTFQGLAPGDYTLKIVDGSGDWAWQWWSGKSSFASADTFIVGAGQDVTGKDLLLEPGATISGTITDTAGSHAAIYPVLYTATGSTDNAETYLDAPSGTLISNQNARGNYTIKGLPTGSYKVAFSSYSSGPNFDGGLWSADPFVAQWFDGNPSYAAATPVVVNTPGQAVSSIDAVMERPRFADVPNPLSAFYPYIQWMISEGISTGTAQPTGKPLYKPSDAVSRQAMSAFLYRLSRDSFVPPSVATFADVPTTSGFFKQVEWMADTGISTGTVQPTGKPLYKPSDAVSRQAMAAFLYRMSGDTFVAPSEATFADVSTTSTFFTQIEWMAANGISTGTAQPSGKPLFKASDPVSRQAMAAFLYRYDATLP